MATQKALANFFNKASELLLAAGQVIEATSGDKAAVPTALKKAGQATAAVKAEHKEGKKRKHTQPDFQTAWEWKSKDLKAFEKIFAEVGNKPDEIHARLAKDQNLTIEQSAKLRKKIEKLSAVYEEAQWEPSLKLSNYQVRSPEDEEYE